MAKPLNWRSTSKPDQACSTRKTSALPDRDLAGGKRAVARALDLRVEVAVDDVVVGAARAAHRDRADQKQQAVRRDRAGSVRRDRRRAPPTTSTARAAATSRSAGRCARAAGRGAGRRREAVDPVSAGCVGKGAVEDALSGLEGAFGIFTRPTARPAEEAAAAALLGLLTWRALRSIAAFFAATPRACPLMRGRPVVVGLHALHEAVGNLAPVLIGLGPLQGRVAVATSLPNIAQASCGSTLFFLPPSAWRRATMALRSPMCFWMSMQGDDCADAVVVRAASTTGKESRQGSRAQGATQAPARSGIGENVTTA